jgi:hypothetical protein
MSGCVDGYEKYIKEDFVRVCGECEHQSDLMCPHQNDKMNNNYIGCRDGFKQKDRKSISPPLGLRPRKIAIEQRISEILCAMQRYNDAGKKIPVEWVDELVFIVK